MFTGIIEEIGKVESIRRNGPSSMLEICVIKVAEGTTISDSISVNGVCLTVESLKNGILSFQIMDETLKRTNLKSLRKNDSVNLERSLKAGGRFGGHFVYGHIDGIRPVVGIKSEKREGFIDIGLQRDDRRFVIDKGSVAIDGISLTIGRIFSDKMRIFLISHTLKNTTIFNKKIRDYVNIEFDAFGKYANNHTVNRKVTEKFLKEAGF